MAIAVLQWLGSGIVILGTTALGRVRADRYRKRPRDLRRIIGSLRALKSDIRYARVPLADALERASGWPTERSVVSHFFHQAADHLLQPGITAEQAWEQAVEDLVVHSSVTLEDRDILLQLSKYMGQSGPEEQTGHLDAAVALLDAREKEAIDDRQRYERVYQTAGVLTGVLIVLLLI